MRLFGSLSGLKNIANIPVFGKKPDSQSKQKNIFENHLDHTFEDINKPYSHINALDTEIYRETLYEHLPTQSLRLELQIEMVEKKLNEVDKEMHAAKLLTFEGDREKFEELENKKRSIIERMNKYKSQYRALGFMYRVGDICNEFYSTANNQLNNFTISFKSHPAMRALQQFFPELQRRYEINQALQKLQALQFRALNLINTSPSFGKIDEKNIRLTQILQATHTIGSGIRTLMQTQPLTKINEHFDKFKINLTEQAMKVIDKYIFTPAREVYSKSLRFYESITAKSQEL